MSLDGRDAYPFKFGGGRTAAQERDSVALRIKMVHEIRGVTGAYNYHAPNTFSQRAADHIRETTMVFAERLDSAERELLGGSARCVP
jgi:hypothetical protein